MWRAAAILVLVGQLLFAGCGSVSGPIAGPSEPIEVFGEPPAPPGPQWSFNGTKVDWHVISTAAGATHCGMQGITLMLLGWPAGTYQKFGSARMYIREPLPPSPVESRYLVGTFDGDARLPAGSKPTGLTLGHLALFVGPDADRAIYIVGLNTTERWPRSDPPMMCV